MFMKVAVAVIGLVALGSLAAWAEEFPKGEVTKHTFGSSQIFPGTTREYWIYVPKQYDPNKPACVHVNQDGVQYNAPAVFDELIAKGEMPVTIGVFVRPGHTVPEFANGGLLLCIPLLRLAHPCFDGSNGLANMLLCCAASANEH